MTMTDSPDDSVPPESTVPSSPQSDLTVQDSKPAGEVSTKEIDARDDDSAPVTKEIDQKSLQLMTLLRTSSVSRRDL